MLPSNLATEINKVLGQGTIKMGSDPSLVVAYLPTGVLPIDALLQGGLPRGRFTEVYGDYSTLKTFVGLRAIATVQQSGGVCALVDTEHAFDPKWAAKLGVKVNDLIYQAPPTGELAVDVTEALIRQKVDLVVWDSVAATLPQDEQTKREHGEHHQPARLAALMSRAARKLTAANERTAILFINQTRLNIGVMFGSPEVVPGGKALGFYSSFRVSLKKAGTISEQVKQWDGEKQVTARVTKAQKIKATVSKSKLGAPFSEVYFIFDLATGDIDEPSFLFNMAIDKGYFTQKGGWWYDSKGNRWHGSEAVIAAIGQDKTLASHLRSLIFPGVQEPRKAKGGRPKRKS